MARRGGALRAVGWGLAALILLGLGLFFTVVPRVVQRMRNPVGQPPPYQASAEATALHKGLFIADLHTDSLLWRRDLNQRSDIGHVDVPRLIEAGVGLQAFTVVTHSPKGQNYQHNTADSDNITLLAIAQRWPVAAWTSKLARARYQARKLEGFAEASEGRLTLIRSKEDLDAFLASHQRDPNQVAGFLGLEGGHALEGDLANVDVLFKDGFRMMAPVHFTDNGLGGSAHGAQKGGLTDFGRQVIQRQQELGILVDVAHASEATIDDTLRLATRPVVMSHGGVRGTCDNSRNLTDRHVDGIARTGGVIGIGLWETATCGEDAAAAARAMRYVADRVGVRHVALGTDYDGAVVPPFDVTGLPLLTEALMAQGFSADEIGLIMGGNTLRVLREVLPSR